VSQDPRLSSRRNALKCMAFGGAGTLFALSGGIFTPIDLAVAAADQKRTAGLGKPLFVQISDTHIGFNKDANPDVNATLTQTIDLVNAMPEQPALILHTGDITHLSKPAEFDMAQQMLARLRTTELHTVPGEHDTTDATVTEYFNRFGKASNNKGYYSFDHAGVHFIALVNVLQFKPGGLGSLGPEQLAWVAADLQWRSSSTPIVVFAHMPLWTVYEPWGWGTGDADQLMSQLRRFGSVTVLNGHIHQIVQKVEGNVTFHTA
jgi:3',5'-cyclic AMP phosphodiesterase CpdA